MKLEFCLNDASKVHAKYRNRPILNMEILGAKDMDLIDTAVKMSVTGRSFYKTLVEKGQIFEKLNLRIGLADGEVIFEFGV